MDLPVTTLCNHILIYIGTATAATGAALKQFYNYADQVTGDDCLVTAGNAAGTCSIVVTSTLITNCVFYADATTCLTCKTGFFVDGISCTECVTNCAVCTTATDC